jgi:hypothetical protein
MRLASAPAPFSSFARVLMVPQPVSSNVADIVAAQVAVLMLNRIRVLLFDLIELSRRAGIRQSPVMMGSSFKRTQGGIRRYPRG